MENWKKFSRVFFLFALLTSLLAGISAPVLGNESASAAPMAQATALDIQNIVNNPTPSIGSNIVFTIRVDNLTASDATGVQVNALLPPELEYVSHAITPTPSIPAVNYDNVLGVWNIEDLNINAFTILNITAKVISVTSTGTIIFPAEVSSNEFANVITTETVTPILSTQANLSLSQSWSRSTTAAGRVDLKITVTNNEAANSATNVQVRDLLPSGLTYFSHSGGTYSNSTGIWAVGTLTAGSSSTLTIIATVSTSTSSTISRTNFAEIWQSDQYDPDSTPGNGDMGEDDDTSLNSNPGPDIHIADLSLTETVDYSGGNAVFTVTVRNSGPDDANNILIKNSKLATAANYTYISHSSTAGTYIPTPGIPTSGDWTIPTLLNGQSATLVVTTAIVSPAVNWAQISGVIEVDPDSRPDNCSNTVVSCTEDDDASAPSADLSITQSVNNPNPDVGTNVVFTITVSNAGVAATTNVQVKSLLPSGLTYVSDDGGGRYNKTSGIWTVTTSTDPPFANGASQTLKITAKVAANGIKTNWAEVWKSDEADPDSIPGNGSITEDDDEGATITSYRSVVINEVAWSGTAASADDEWIELYNPSNASINITGWVLKSTSTASSALNITLSGSIAAGGYFLLERDNNSTVSDVIADQIYTGGSLNILSDSGEMLVLCGGIPTSGQCGETLFIDTANQEGSSSSTNPWPKGSLSPNYGSMERAGISAETDKSWATNIGNPRNGVNANNGPIYGTPKKVNSTGATPPPIPVVPTVIVYSSRIVINEFLPRPGFDWNQDGQVDVFDEFIEIKNIGNATGSISGWKLDDEVNQGSNPFTLPDVTLKVGERMVFYGSQTNILLSDGGDTARLLDPNGKVFDSYTYSFAEFEDQSICRLPDGFGSWYEDCVPTPNLTNTREGAAPSMPDSGGDFVSPVCDLPDTLPADFLFAECGGYGADVWHSYFWDQSGWYSDQNIPSNMSKRKSFVQ